MDARDAAELWITHVTYTMTQGVFQVFRRRLSTRDAIALMAHAHCAVAWMSPGSMHCSRGFPRGRSSSGHLDHVAWPNARELTGFNEGDGFSGDALHMSDQGNAVVRV